MYGQNHQTYVDAHGFDDISEGKCRPGHFKGVATIVTKLFNIVQPTNAYFGQKDAAQCVLIQRIVQDLDINVNVHIVPTMREEDGLAMSSRNVYLKENERAAASVLYKSLQAAQAVYESAFAGGFPISSNVLQDVVQNTLDEEPMVSDIQYISIDCKENMMPLSDVDENGAIISIACKIGNVRLIDNIIL
jgi:pantoate--beta-alanine ligase